jgi:CBS domain-containing protein
MLKVKDIMTTKIISVSPDTDIVQAAKLLLENHINGMPVMDGDRLVGILCQSDLIAQQKRFPVPNLFTFLDGFISLTSIKQLEHEINKFAAITVEQAMTPKPVTVKPDTSIEDVASLMVDKYYHSVPVVEGDKLVGIIGKEDILRTVMSAE